MATETRQTLDSLTETICDYLEQKSVKGALLLYGEWGCGKTTFFKQRLAPELTRREKKKAIYLSVAGLSTLDELDDQLLAAVFPLITSSVAQFATIGAKALMRHLKIEPKEIKPKADVNESMAVCVDDLERFDGKPAILFGFIQNLLEVAGVQCLLIGDDERMRERHAEDASPQAYRFIREKIVAKHVKFKPSTDQALDEIVLGLAGQRAREMLAGQREEILALFRHNKTENIRTINAAIATCVPILESAANVGLSEERTRTIICMALAVMIEARSNHETAEKLYAFLTRPFDWLAAVAFEKDTDHPIGRFTKKYAHLDTQQWPAVPRIADFLATGIFDRDALERELSSLKAVAEQTPFLRLTNGNVLDLTDEQFRDDQTIYFDELRTSGHARLDQIARGASALIYLAQMGVTELSLSQVLEAHRAAVVRHLASSTLDADDFERLAHEDSLAAIERIGPDGVELVRTIRAAVQTAKNQVKAAARSDLLRLFLNDFDGFLEEAFDSARQWRYIPLFVDLDHRAALDSLSKRSPKQLSRLREFLRWRGVVRAQGMAIETPTLVAICEGLRPITAEVQSPLMRLGLLTLMRVIDQVVAAARPEDQDE